MGVATAIVHRSLDGCKAEVRLTSDGPLQPKEVEDQVLEMLRNPPEGQVICWNQTGDEPVDFAEGEDFFVERVIIDQNEQEEIVVPLDGPDMLSKAAQESGTHEISDPGPWQTVLLPAEEADFFVSPDGVTVIDKAAVQMAGASKDLGYDLLLEDGTQLFGMLPGLNQTAPPTEAPKVEE